MQAARRRSTTSAAWTCSAPTRPARSPRRGSGSSGTSTPPGATARACSSSPISTASSRPGSEARSTRRSSRTRRSTSRGWTQARRGAVRLRAPPRLGAGRRRRRAPARRQGRASRTSCALSPHYEEAARPSSAPLDDDGARARCIGLLRGARREGFRVLGIAWQRGRPRSSARRGRRRDRARLRGFVAFLDPPKASAAEALAALAASGVAVKIVTGDNELVTQHVCAQLGAPGRPASSPAPRSRRWTTHALRGARRRRRTCSAASRRRRRTASSRRSSARGHVVGYLGDGINDAPSLHSADVGISVDRRRRRRQGGRRHDPAASTISASSTTACSRAGAPSATS